MNRLELAKLIETEFEDMMILETKNGTIFGGPEGMDAFELYDNRIKIFTGYDHSVIHDLSNMSKKDIIELLEKNYFNRYNFSNDPYAMISPLDYYYNLKFINNMCYNSNVIIELTKGKIILNQGEKIFNITENTLFIDIENFFKTNGIIKSIKNQ